MYPSHAHVPMLHLPPGSPTVAPPDRVQSWLRWPIRIAFAIVVLILLLVLLGALEGGPRGFGGDAGPWGIGLLSGLAIGLGTRIPWRELPERFAFWWRLQRRRVWWMIWGAVFAAVLAFY